MGSEDDLCSLEPEPFEEKDLQNEEEKHEKKTLPDQPRPQKKSILRGQGLTGCLHDIHWRY